MHRLRTPSGDVRRRAGPLPHSRNTKQTACRCTHSSKQTITDIKNDFQSPTMALQVCWAGRHPAANARRCGMSQPVSWARAVGPSGQPTSQLAAAAHHPALLAASLHCLQEKWRFIPFIGERACAPSLVPASLPAQPSTLCATQPSAVWDSALAQLAPCSPPQDSHLPPTCPGHRVPPHHSLPPAVLFSVMILLVPAVMLAVWKLT